MENHVVEYALKMFGKGPPKTFNRAYQAMDRVRVKMEGLRCPVCGRPVEKGESLCPLHSRAFTNLKRAFKVWEEAYGGRISLKEYLEEIVGQPETGEASKELALRILKGELEWDEG